MTRAGVLALVVSVVLGLGAVWLVSRGERDFGAEVVREMATASTTSPQAVAGAPVPTRPADLPVERQDVPPTSLSVPGIGLTARVVPTGVDDNAEFAVPPSVDVVGWYEFGVGLDSPAGSLVIGGHVDSATDGPGAFYRLRELDRGDEVALTGQDGRVRRYRVVAREQYPKKDLDLGPYFTSTGAPRLTLFTCGGEFDRATRSYVDNVVVTAEPV
ncbi:class F sortase [Lentzea albida]|uniref:Sortase family protein n=1 Tax=Lentzea albida TaxID=65499 RepID=A0A1H9ENS9_9PSEU|nr:class F sortase [Lentzea albida]SEQ27275.1 Sortase family protein [Lentzea albida]